MIIDRAVRFATLAHARQQRKGSELPYIIHPVGVALLLAQAGADQDVIAAGLLHDTIEDCGVTREQLEAEFGPRVAALVVGCSEPDRSLPWEERKAHTFAYLKTAPRAVKLIACADKLHNVRSMIEDHQALGEALWSRFNRGREQQAWYYRGLVEAFRDEIEGGIAPSLFAAFQAEVAQLFGS